MPTRAHEKEYGMTNVKNYSSVEKVIGRMDSWPCKLLIFSYPILILYVFFDLVVINVGYLIGLLISIPFFMAMYCLPVIYVIEPLSDNELDEYKTFKKEMKKQKF